MEHASAGTGRSRGKVVVLTNAGGELTRLIEAFCSTYTHPDTRLRYRQFLGELFAVTGASHPSELTVGGIVNACDPRSAGLSNNTIRNRLGMTARFLTWCERRSLVSPLVVEEAVGRLSPLRRIPRTFGKVQAPYPGRWLTREQAEAIIATCDTRTDIGLRDRIAIRLGLLGMRITEVGRLTWHAVRLAENPPAVVWTGKQRRTYTSVLSRPLVDDLTEYATRYTAGLGRTFDATDPIYCAGDTRKQKAGVPRPLQWGRPVAHPRNRLHEMLLARAEAAGVGHVSFHDLRRTAAGLLHRATDEHGAHLFDLLDIQKVLHHADPAVTLRYCLEPMDNTVSERASDFLDM